MLLQLLAFTVNSNAQRQGYVLSSPLNRISKSLLVLGCNRDSISFCLFLSAYSALFKFFYHSLSVRFSFTVVVEDAHLQSLESVDHALLWVAWPWLWQRLDGQSIGFEWRDPECLHGVRRQWCTVEDGGPCLLPLTHSSPISSALKSKKIIPKNCTIK